jgi:hypothetical protein
MAEFHTTLFEQVANGTEIDASSLYKHKSVYVTLKIEENIEDITNYGPSFRTEKFSLNGRVTIGPNRKFNIMNSPIMSIPGLFLIMTEAAGIGVIQLVKGRTKLCH